MLTQEEKPAENYLLNYSIYGIPLSMNNSQSAI